MEPRSVTSAIDGISNLLTGCCGVVKTDYGLRGLNWYCRTEATMDQEKSSVDDQKVRDVLGKL